VQIFRDNNNKFHKITKSSVLSKKCIISVICFFFKNDDLKNDKKSRKGKSVPSCLDKPILLAMLD